MVEHTNLEEYDDPEIYDFENRAFEPDGPFYLELAQRMGGSTLELGCGAGRVAIPLARHGVDLTGLDISAAMLSLARRKAGDVVIRWTQADVRAFHLPTQFHLIYMAGGSFHHMLSRTDQEALLTRVREHLHPQGVFVFDAIMPSPALMTNVDTEEPWYSYEDARGRTIHLSGTQHYDPLLQIKHETAYRRWTGVDGQEVIKRARLALRYVFPQELEALLHYNGLSMVERYGTWDRTALMEASKTMIVACMHDHVPNTPPDFTKK
jgi:SAM-dependent methyltransferase